jgi:diguanylate cyclase (GGDEF)-like protein/PAS domain S-box-containing protein
MLRSIFEHAAIGMALVDRTGRPVESNPALSRMLGYTAEELAALPFEELTHPEDAQAEGALFAELREGKREHYQIETRYLRKDGDVVWGRLTVSLLRDDEGRSTHALAMVEDITERKRAEEAREREHALLEQFFESAPAAVVLVDPDDRVLRINPEFTRLFGYTEAEAVGQRLGELIAPEPLQDEARALTGQAAAGGRAQMETVRRREDGRTLHVSVVGVPVRLQGNEVAVYGLYRDITTQKEVEAALERQATTDPLTGLLNRRGFLALLAKEWERAKHAGDAPLLLYADLDGLKQINDRYGHAEGDRVLQDVAEILKRCFRASDAIARLGGDEFAILAADAEEHSERIMRERVRRALERVSREAGRPYRISISLGATRVQAGEAASAEEWLAEADRRMYEQKREKAPANDGNMET